MTPYAWTDSKQGDTVERHCVDIHSRPICGKLLDPTRTHHCGGGYAYLGEVPRPRYRSGWCCARTVRGWRNRSATDGRPVICRCVGSYVNEEQAMSRYYNRQARADWAPYNPTIDECLHQLREHGARVYRYRLHNGDRWQLRGKLQHMRRDIDEADALVIIAREDVVQVVDGELGLEYAYRVSAQLVG